MHNFYGFITTMEPTVLISRGRGAIAASLSSSLFLEYRELTSSMVGTKYEKKTGEFCAKHTNCPSKIRFFAKIFLLSYNLYDFKQSRAKEIVHNVYKGFLVNQDVRLSEPQPQAQRRVTRFGGLS
jgi:hypothetical protein